MSTSDAMIRADLLSIAHAFDEDESFEDTVLYYIFGGEMPPVQDEPDEDEDEDEDREVELFQTQGDLEDYLESLLDR